MLSVHLNDNLAPEAVKTIQNVINRLEGVERVGYVEAKELREFMDCFDE